MCAFSVTATHSFFSPDWEGHRTFTRQMFEATGVGLTLLLGWVALRSASSRTQSAEELDTDVATFRRTAACGFVAYLLVRAADLGTALSLMLI